MIVELELIEPEEKFWLLLAIVSVEPPPEANKPKLLNVWAFPDTSLLLFKTSAISSIVVTPVTSTKPRILVTLNYNEEEGVKLSENARLTFFGRIN